MILSLRTDTDWAEVALFGDDGTRIAYDRWEAGRNLSSELLAHIRGLLDGQKADWKDISGVLVFRGPGSFTGLRIGVTVANTIAYSENVPIVGTVGEGWLTEGLTRLAKNENDTQILPHYGAEPNITLRKPRSDPSSPLDDPTPEDVK